MSRFTVRVFAARVLALLCLLALPAGAGAALTAEQITRFAADIAIQPSGDLLETETITVRAEGDRIRRGLFRTVPLAGPGGSRMGFSLVSADRDGGPVPTELTWNDAGVRVRLGDPERDLAIGEHVFTLTYRASGTVLADAEADSLTWNVTGSAWDFPIAEATARLTLPGATPPLSWRIATGAPGSGESNAETAIGADGALGARALTALPPGHGMTLRAEFPKNLVVAKAPSAEAAAGATPQPALLDGLPAALAALGVVLVYYGAAWWWLGRDPAAGALPPRALPPANMSPAAVRFVRRMGYDTRCLAAAIVNMAVNGYLSIDRRPDGGWALHRTGLAEETLFPEERAVAGKLFFALTFERGLDDGDGRWLRQASEALRESLEKANADRLFVTNRAALAGGIVLSALAGLAMLAAVLPLAGALVATGVLVVSAAVVAYLGVQAWRRLRLMVRGRGIWRTLKWLAVSVPLLLLALLAGIGLTLDLPLPPLAGIAALVAATVFFAWALKAPTADGRRLQDEIEALAAFLRASGGPGGAAAAVGDATLPPDRYLPYALALDEEAAWAAGFGASVAAAGLSGEDLGTAAWAWYDGGGTADAVDLTKVLGGDLTGSIDSAAAPPPDDDDADPLSSSSSSSGGSGFSVGSGFGGGGGGGF